MSGDRGCLLIKATPNWSANQQMECPQRRRPTFRHALCLNGTRTFTKDKPDLLQRAPAEFAARLPAEVKQPVEG